MSSWDFENLASEMSELETDMTQFGFAAETENVNIDDFFTDAEPKEKEPQKIQCPHCGEWFEK
jgi:hypothetical protein